MMNRIVLGISLAIALGCLISPLGAKEPESKASGAIYARPYEPPTRSAFLPLPPGCVEPQGWLRDWCLAARDGATGHLDEIDQTGKCKRLYDQTWTPDTARLPDMATRDPMDFFPHPMPDNEVVAYWLDGMVRLGYVLHDDFLTAKARSRLDVIAEKTTKDSLLFMWWINRNDQEFLKRLGPCAKWLFDESPDDFYYALQYCSANIGHALTACYAATGDERVLRALRTAYGGEHGWVHSHLCLPNAVAAFETYTWSGDEPVKSVLSQMYKQCRIDVPDVRGTFLGSRKFPIYLRHGVVIHECTGPWAIGYLWTGDPVFYQRTRDRLNLLERDSLQPFGVNIGDEEVGLTSAFRGTETCDVVQYMWNYIWLLRIGGEGRWGDRVERAMFNAAPATVSRDFKTHVYYQSPNRISATLPGSEDRKNQNCRFNYAPCHSPKCCTFNLQRMLPNYVMHMWMATYDNGLAATLYGPSTVNALVGDRVPVKIGCQTAYPFEEKIMVNVTPERETEFPLYFRLPAWCESPSIRLNGEDVAAVSDGRGFVRILRSWKAGDRVELQFPMPIRIEGGHDHGVEGPGPDAIDAVGGPYASIHVGPLLMALPIADTDPNTPDSQAAWQYAFDLPSAREVRKLFVTRGAMPSKWDWPLRSPLELSLPAARADWMPTRLSDKIHSNCLPTLYTLPPRPLSSRSAEKIKLVPYGCTKFRISMFPVTQRALWVTEKSREGGAAKE